MTTAALLNSDTSHESKKRIERYLSELQARVITAMQLGAGTDEEIELMTGLRHQTASARRRELVIMGRVYDSGERRRTSSGRRAVVWKLTPGQLALLC